MDRKELLALRQTVWSNYDRMNNLGAYDANAPILTICLESILKLIDHTLDELKKKK